MKALTQKQNIATLVEFVSPEAAIAWADEVFHTKVVATSSFQTQSLPFLFFLSKAAPHIPVLFADTGHHFPQTLEFRDQVVDLLGLNLIITVPDVAYSEDDEGVDSSTIKDVDTCCLVNKVKNVAGALKPFDAWLSGIRRDQTPTRERSPFITFNDLFGVYKISPMLDWSWSDIHEFIEVHDLPRHPLWDQGYRSVGCVPCTRPIVDGETGRAGRWDGMGKIECGLHDF